MTDMNDFQVLLLVGPADDPHIAALQEALADDPVVSTLHRESLNELETVFQEAMPDLVLVAADALEARGEDVVGFCQRVRVPAQGSIKFRSLLILQSTAGSEKRIAYLANGADDVLSPDLAQEELNVRLMAHLRRNIETHTSDVTFLPGVALASRILQRRINRREPWALLVVELDYFNVYSEVYGQLPADQVLRTFAALLGRFVLMPDFTSQSEENTFLVMTHPDKAEKIAALLCRQFETVAPNFYSEKDRKQGYIISIVDQKVSRRVPLLSLSIGIVSSQTRPYENFMSAFNAALQMKALARMTPGSHWHSERPQLSGTPGTITEAVPDLRGQKSILVLESDAALAYLLKTTLEMEGYAVEVTSVVEEARQMLAERTHHLLLIDALLNGGENGLDFMRETRENFADTRILCISSLHNRDKVLRAGADLYLPKPFELLSLFSWTARLLQGQ